MYMDMTERRQVRETAFISLIDTIPGPAMLQMIVATQRKERSLPVASMVYNYLCNVARMTLPGLETLSVTHPSHSALYSNLSVFSLRTGVK